MNIPELRHDELEKYLLVKYNVKQAVMILGYAGTGKSAHVRDFAKRMADKKGLKFVDKPSKHRPGETFLFLDLRASQLEPTDVVGIPRISGEKTEWLLPEFWPEEGEGIIFFDEINHASEQVLRALYQIILDRRVGWNYELPQEFWVIAAGNLDEEDPFLTEMPAPLRDRFAFVRLKPPTAEEWIAYVGGRVDPRVTAYISKYPSELHKFESNSTVFPTPRSWERVGMAIKGIEDLETIINIAASDLGIETASRFVKFLKAEYKLPAFDEIKANPEMVKDLDAWMIVSYTGEIAEMYNKGEEVGEIVGAILKYKPEAGIVIIRAVANNREHVKMNILAQISKTKYLNDAKKVLKQLGVYKGWKPSR